jgi:hypothetical protein
LVAKTFDSPPVDDKYQPGQRPLILFAEPGGFPAYFFINFSQYLFRDLSVSQNTQQETEEQAIRRLKKEPVSSFIASRYPWE